MSHNVAPTQKLLGRSVKWTDDNDISFQETDDGAITFDMIEGPREVGQAVEIALSTTKGEDPFNRGFGVDRPSIARAHRFSTIRNLVRETILQVGRVERVERVATAQVPQDKIKRVIGVGAKIKLIDGSEVESSMLIA